MEITDIAAYYGKTRQNGRNASKIREITSEPSKKHKNAFCGPPGNLRDIWDDSQHHCLAGKGREGAPAAEPHRRTPNAEPHGRSVVIFLVQTKALVSIFKITSATSWQLELAETPRRKEHRPSRTSRSAGGFAGNTPRGGGQREQPPPLRTQTSRWINPHLSKTLQR